MHNEFCDPHCPADKYSYVKTKFFMLLFPTSLKCPTTTLHKLVNNVMMSRSNPARACPRLRVA